MKCPNCQHDIPSPYKNGMTHFRSGNDGPAICGKPIHPGDEISYTSKVSHVVCSSCLRVINSRVRVHAKALEDMRELQSFQGQKAIDALEE